MRSLVRITLALACAAVVLSRSAAEPPAARPADDAADKAKDYGNAPLVVRMMALDKNKDGKLTKDEVTDERLQRLFDQADANKDGVVTREELTALAARLDAEAPRRGGFAPPDGPPPDRDNPRPPRGDRGPDDRGPGDHGPHGAPPRPGQVLPGFIQDALKLTADQKKQLDELQKDVDAKLDKILTDDQKKQLKDMRPPHGPGPGGPDGPPPPRPGGPDRPGPDRDRPNDR